MINNTISVLNYGNVKNRDLKRRARLTREIPRVKKVPVLWPFCPVLFPLCPSHKSLKFAGTVLFLPRPPTVNMTKRVCRDCPIPNCGAKYLVRLSTHLTDVHALDYIN